MLIARCWERHHARGGVQFGGLMTGICKVRGSARIKEAQSRHNLTRRWCPSSSGYLSLLVLTAFLMSNAPALAQTQPQPRLSYSANHLPIALCQPPSLGVELFYCHTLSGKDISLCLAQKDLKTRFVTSRLGKQKSVVRLTNLRQSAGGGASTIVQGDTDRGTASLYLDASETAVAYQVAGVQFVSKSGVDTDYCSSSSIRFLSSDWKPRGTNWPGGTDVLSLEGEGLAKLFDPDQENGDVVSDFWSSFPYRKVRAK